MNQYRLFLDDFRMPYEVGNYINPVELRKEFRLFEWVIVRNYEQFVNYILKNGLPTHISFDHDLADEHYSQQFQNMPELYDISSEKTGYHCAQWLCDYLTENNLKLPICYVHSMNPIGKENIESLLDCFKKANL